MPDLDRRERTENGAPVMEAGAWAAAVRRGEAPAGVAIRRAVPDVVRAVDEASRTIEIIAGTSNLVRDSMQILVEGYDLTQYRRNPVVPWSHNYWDPPVATCIDMRVENGVFICRDEFMTAGDYAFADMIWKMYSHPRRFLRAASIGLNPLEHETRDNVLVVTRSDVMEHSLCLIGVDPGCLTLARSEGIDVQPFDEWMRRALDEGDQIIPKARAEAIVRALGYGKGLALFSLDPEAIVALRAEEPMDDEDEAEPEVQEGVKPKPFQKAEDGEPEEQPADGEPAAEPAEERCEDDDVILLEDDEPAAETGDDEIEVDDEELRSVISAALKLALTTAQEPPRAEAR